MSRSLAKPKKPSQCIQKCPACGSKDLYRMEVDVLCMKCDWLSCEMHVECGGMDNIFSAFIDHFYGGSTSAFIEASPTISEEITNPVAVPDKMEQEEAVLVTA
jgi:hypothetical protein